MGLTKKEEEQKIGGGAGTKIKQKEDEVRRKIKKYSEVWAERKEGRREASHDEDGLIKGAEKILDREAEQQ